MRIPRPSSTRLGGAIPFLIAAAYCLCPRPANSGENQAVLNDKNPFISSSRALCDLFDKNTLYQGEGFIKSVRHQFRYDGQFVDTSDDYPGGGSSAYWEHRRWRNGLVVDMAHDLTFMTILNQDTTQHFDGDSFFESIFDMRVKWEPSEDFYVILGKQKPSVTREWSATSIALLTAERSALSTNILSLPLWGAAAGFPAGGLRHEAGVYGVAYDDKFAWPAFDDAGISLTYRTSYALNESTELFFEYQYVDTSVDPGFDETFGAGAYEQALALGSESTWGHFGLVTDLVFGLDRRNQTMDDTWGLTIIPYYNLSEKLQVVAKYTYAEDIQIDRPQRFASRPMVDGLSTLYLGLKYRICGDNLKLVGGYEFSSGDQIAGTATPYRNDSWLFGVRTSW